MATASSESPATPILELETTSAEVKRYQRQKLVAGLASTVLSLLALAIVALGAGPAVDEVIRVWVGDNRWLRLIALAFVYAAGMEVLTLPLDFWSGFVLEHRYQLSNQSLRSWVWRQIKGYLIGGPIGLVLLLGLYTVLWFTGTWWWVWATVGLLLVT